MVLEVNQGSDRSWVYKCYSDFSDGELTSSTLAIRFKDKESQLSSLQPCLLFLDVSLHKFFLLFLSSLPSPPSLPSPSLPSSPSPPIFSCGRVQGCL